MPPADTTKTGPQQRRKATDFYSSTAKTMCRRGATVMARMLSLRYDWQEERGTDSDFSFRPGWNSDRQRLPARAGLARGAGHARRRAVELENSSPDRDEWRAHHPRFYTGHRTRTGR